MSTESLLSQTEPAPGVEHCTNCGAPLAPDQRYCLQCGERRASMSSVLAGGPPVERAIPPVPPVPPVARTDSAWQRNPMLTVIAGVGVLLIAMGVGVLIGRAGNGKTVTAPAAVVTVDQGGAGSGAAAPASSEASFTSDWPAGTKGYTVLLQTLPSTDTVSQVEAAKSAATAKGAKSVGALKAEEFSSLGAESGDYVIYSGVDHKRSEAQSALAGLRRSFPGAKVIEVSGGSGGSGAGSSSHHEPESTGSSAPSVKELKATKAAPPTVLNKLKGAKGKGYVEKANQLPEVISTG